MFRIISDGDKIGSRTGEVSNAIYSRFTGRQKEGSDEAIPCILEPQGDEKIFRRNWARLIQKIYKVDPLVCSKCKGAVRIISSIEDPSVIRAILDHLGIWLVRSRPPPKIYNPPIREYAAVDLYLQTHADDFYADPDYSLVPFRVWDEYIYPEGHKQL